MKPYLVLVQKIYGGKMYANYYNRYSEAKEFFDDCFGEYDMISLRKLDEDTGEYEEVDGYYR